MKRSFERERAQAQSLHVITLALAMASLAGCSAPRTSGHPDKSGLLSDLHASFAGRNPRVGTAVVLEVRQNLSADPGREYALLATALAPDASASPNLNNELFGVFVVDSTLTRVLRTIDVFPTQRWKDYFVRFGEPDKDTLEVVASGAMYGDQAVRRVYNWSPSATTPFLVRLYKAPADSIGDGGE